MSTAEESARELLAILPLLNRLMISELGHEAGDDTTMPQFRVLSYLAEEPLTLKTMAAVPSVWKCTDAPYLVSFRPVLQENDE